MPTKDITADRGTPRVAVIMRSYNEVHVIGETLSMLEQQSYPDFELWNFDSGSTDGTFEIIQQHNVAGRILQNDAKSYNPGRVLNGAVSRVNADILVFLNADATPTDRNWLANLIRPLRDPRVGAVYGRQVARPDCRSLFIKDTERAFGTGEESARWVHFFSMANAAARREVLQRFPFETRIQYSEDIEWSYRLKKAGYAVTYVPGAAAIHLSACAAELDSLGSIWVMKACRSRQAPCA